MKNTKKVEADPKSAQVVAILRHIERLNTLIDEHKKVDKDTLMVAQHERLKSEFLLELSALLADYKINVELKIAA